VLNWFWGWAGGYLLPTSPVETKRNLIWAYCYKLQVNLPVWSENPFTGRLTCNKMPLYGQQKMGQISISIAMYSTRYKYQLEISTSLLCKPLLVLLDLHVMRVVTGGCIAYWYLYNYKYYVNLFGTNVTDSKNTLLQDP